MASINDIIKEAMDFILMGNTDTLNILQEQYRNSVISDIDKSPVGCFAEFKLINRTEKIKYQKAYIGDVFLESSQVPLGAGIILFIENGIISMLEIYTYGDDVFPDVFNDYKFFYCNGERDFDTYLRYRK